MGRGVARLLVRIESESDAKGFERQEQAASKWRRGLNTASKVAGVALAGLGVAARGMLREAEAASTSNERLAQINRSMGQTQAGVTEAMVKTANAMARKTGINANEIKQGQAILATFGNINNEAARQAGVFNRATTAATDLSAAGFGSVESASTQLGKALEDPVKGLTALTRVGVSFTAAEQDKIKALVESGEMLEAQNILLGAVEKQTGGVAEATANSSDKMKESWRQAQAALGEGLLPVMDAGSKVVGRLSDFLINNRKAAVIVMGAIAALSVTVITVNAAVKAWTAITRIATAATAAWTAAQRVLNLVMRANPIGLVITAVTILVGLFVTAYQRSERFRNIVQQVGRVAKAAFNASPIRVVIAAISRLVNFVSTLINKIRGIRWPEPPGWVKSIGSAIGSLFGASEYPGPYEPGWAPSGVFPTRRVGWMPHIGGGSSAGTAAAMAALGGGGGVTIINVNGALDPDAVARQIERLLERRATRTGRGVVTRTVTA